MSGGEIAALVAAGAFVVLVGLVAVPILKLGRTLDAATLAIRNAHESQPPTLGNAVTTVEQVERQLEPVDGIGADAPSSGTAPPGSSSGTAPPGSSSVAVPSTVSGPMVKVAAFSYGVRMAAANRRKALEKEPTRGRRPGRT